MSNLSKKRRKLEKELDQIREKYLDAETRHDVNEMEEFESETQEKYRQLSWVKTEELKAKARKYDIVIPSDNTWWRPDPTWEWDPAEAPEMLTDVGRAGALKLIKEERRAQIDEWVKILTLVIGLAGAVTGILAVYFSLSDKPKSEKMETPCIVEPDKRVANISSLR